MSINQKLMANGAFNVSLKPDMPRSVLESLAWLSTVVFVNAHSGAHVQDPSDQYPAEDSYPSTTSYPEIHPLLSMARWAGVLIGRSARSIRGYGMAWWLGDAETGEPYESETLFGEIPLPTVMRHLLPQAILPGRLHDTGDVFTGVVGRYQLPRTAIDYVSTIMRTEWRVNPDGTFDAGSESQLFSDLGLLPYPSETAYPSEIEYPQEIVPAAVIVAAKYAGTDVSLRTLAAAALEADQDVEGYANGALVVGEGLVAAKAQVDSPFRDPHGNPVRITKLISDPEVNVVNAAQRAAVEVEKLTETRTAVTVSVDDYHVTDPSGQAPAAADVGATVWTYDPDEGLFDVANPVRWRGQTIYPVALRVLGASTPIDADTGVYVGNPDGTFTDITPYVQVESGPASLEVGATRRTLQNLSRQGEAFRARVADSK